MNRMTLAAQPVGDHVPILTVLVVDDMKANRAVIGRRLEKLDYHVTCVDSGRAALEQLAERLPDVLLLDYMMPQMNGIEVLRELRASPRTRELPVIMVTARAESEAIVEALAAGADDYVTKPIDFEVLRARIETHVSKRSDAMHLQRANAALDERATMRSMVLADLETELKDEIRRRQELEKKLAAATAIGTRSGSATGAEPDPQPAKAPGGEDLTMMLNEIANRFEATFVAIMAGRTVNLAQMAETRSLLARVRQTCA